MRNGAAVVAASDGALFDPTKIDTVWKLLAGALLVISGLAGTWFARADGSMERVLAGLLAVGGVVGLGIAALMAWQASQRPSPTRYGDSPSDPVAAGRPSSTPEAADGTRLGIAWDKPGDLFWLGNDLMWISDVLLRGGSSEDIELSLRQAVHHARQLGLRDEDVDRLNAVAANHKPTKHWTPDRRDSLSRDVRSLAVRIGRTAASQQGPTFQPWAPGVDPDAQ